VLLPAFTGSNASPRSDDTVLEPWVRRSLRLLMINEELAALYTGTNATLGHLNECRVVMAPFAGNLLL